MESHPSRNEGFCRNPERSEGVVEGDLLWLTEQPGASSFSRIIRASPAISLGDSILQTASIARCVSVAVTATDKKWVVVQFE